MREFHLAVFTWVSLLLCSTALAPSQTGGDRKDLSMFSLDSRSTLVAANTLQTLPDFPATSLQTAVICSMWRFWPLRCLLASARPAVPGFYPVHGNSTAGSLTAVAHPMLIVAIPTSR
jgi:hypothetical protein